MFFYRTSGQTVEKVTKMKDTALIQPFIACHPSGDKLKLITRVNYRHCSLKIKGQIIYINDQTTTTTTTTKHGGNAIFMTYYVF